MDKFLFKFERWLIPGVAVLCINILPAWYVLTRLKAPEAPEWLKSCMDWLPALNAATINAGTFSLGIVYAVLLGFVLDSLKIYRWYPESEELKWKMRRKIIEGFGIASPDATKKNNAKELSKKLHDHIFRGSYGDIDEKVTSLRANADLAVIVMQCFVILEFGLIGFVLIYASCVTCSQFLFGFVIAVAAIVVLCASIMCCKSGNKTNKHFESDSKPKNNTSYCVLLALQFVLIMEIVFIYDPINIMLFILAELSIVIFFVIILLCIKIKDSYDDATDYLYYLIKLTRDSNRGFFADCLLELAREGKYIELSYGTYSNGTYQVKAD